MAEGPVVQGNGAAVAGRTRVLVVDDQTVVREGIVMLLGLLPGVEVVGAAGDGVEALRLVAERMPDVVLMDLRMPRMDGVEATRRIRADHPATEVVVLTTYADDDSLFPALRAGARGYLTKDAAAEEIARAIIAVRSGAAGLSPEIQRRLLDRVACDGSSPPSSRPSAASSSSSAPGASGGRAHSPLPPAPGAESAPASASAPGPGSARVPGWVAAPAAGGVHERSVELPDGLTSREADVLQLIGAGLSNREIAERLFVSVATVKTHINNLFAKTGVRDRAQAVRYAYAHGFVAPSQQ